jgi:phosphoserine phosphatase
MAQVEAFAQQGMRVLGVGYVKDPPEIYPESQEDFAIEYLGLVAFIDPPKPNIREVFSKFEDAGINVKIITGDNAVTTAAIAKQIGFHGDRRTLDGEELLRLEEPAFSEAVRRTDIFTRMFPEAKLRIINALKADGHVVAMTGDGVNDGPALKAAHIGVAMGKRGSELAKEAASLVLTDDDLAGMVEGVAMGRKIYDNLKKAVQYIISIHIPIILTVSLPLFLGWKFPSIFTPMHVIFLELIMGPTCSIAYESEPLEEGGMQRPPRPLGQHLPLVEGDPHQPSARLGDHARHLGQLPDRRSARLRRRGSPKPGLQHADHGEHRPHVRGPLLHALLHRSGAEPEHRIACGGADHLAGAGHHALRSTGGPLVRSGAVNTRAIGACRRDRLCLGGLVRGV